MTDDSLKPFFEPRSVAIIGASATPGKPGHEVIRNLQANGYEGEIHLVNPKGGSILGMPVYTDISQLPDRIDHAVVIVSAKDTPRILRAGAEKGIGHFVLSAGGFSEVDEEGQRLQHELEALVQKFSLRILGPNTSGHISMPAKYTSSFFPLGKLHRGRVSFIAQTGNFATHTMKQILTTEHFSVSRVIGLGNKIDIDETHALEYLAGDNETDAVIMYLESIMRPRRFLEVARQVTKVKPVVVLKGGATEAGRHAATAHTAAMAAEDRLVDGMLRQGGMVRIRDYTRLIHMAKALSMITLPKGNRVGFMAPSGAMLVVLSDLCNRLGLAVPELQPESVRRLQEISPPFIRMRNPIDIWASASTRGVEFAYREGLEVLLRDPMIDAVVIVFMLTRETGIPKYGFVVDLVKKYPQKPVLVTFSADKSYMEKARRYLEPKGVPTFVDIEEPFEVIALLCQCYEAMNADGPRGKCNK